MQKIFLPLLFVIIVITQSNAQQRLFDQPVQLKTCNITIDANPFIATTVVEMEFYNPSDQEVEGYQSFQLNRGQVITAFQLELNGKYREGSIEDRWKARQAYGRIVGKRVDPAILQMNGLNNYSLNIYPIPAKGSRKISFTITQMMEEDSAKLTYNLPLNFRDITENCTVSVKMNNTTSMVYANKGLLNGRLFTLDGNLSELFWQTKNITLNKSISFSVDQHKEQPQVCINTTNGKTGFVMRVFPDVPVYYPVKPAVVDVYWDASLSAKERDLVKEVNFLEKYVELNDIKKLRITFFNQQLRETLVYTVHKNAFNDLRNYLIYYKYTGATELGNLDLSSVRSDAVLLFSDGINSIGNRLPKQGTVQVNCIVSATENNYKNLFAIAGNSGGTVINLRNSAVDEAAKRTSRAENFLAAVSASFININEEMPQKLGKSILLSGTINRSDDLQLLYGNNNSINKTVSYFLPATESCSKDVYAKMRMLMAYDSIMYRNGGYNYWQNMLVFGLTEKVVTPQTSYLVLERVEDYINYKIAPPKELEEKCAEMNYVYKNEYKLQALKTYTEQDLLKPVADEYNKRIHWWSANENPIDITRQVTLDNSQNITAGAPEMNKPAGNSNIALANNISDNNNDMKEVVVTGAFGIKRAARSSTSNVQVISREQLNTIRQTNINNALAGKIAGVQVRSQSAGKLGAETLIRLRGENGLGVGNGPIYVVDGTILTDAADIDIDNIEDVSVLQGPSSAALFGPDGANGAIVINLKKRYRSYQYNTWTQYKLSSVEEVSYMQEIRQAAYSELWDTYKGLEETYGSSIGFHLDMADYFFEKKETEMAGEILYTAVELCKGKAAGLKLVAYVYEKWKKFDKAIEIYKGIISIDETDLMTKRDLALAYFQNRNYAAAVKTYYAIIMWPDENNYFKQVKEYALAEMNAVIAIGIKDLDISYINQNIIRALPVDLRITAEGNYSDIRNFQVVEPGGILCNSSYPVSVNGGRISQANDYWDGDDVSDYSIKEAHRGSYRLKVDVGRYYNYGGMPDYVRVVVFRNFQTKNPVIEVENIVLDNQYGEVEIQEVNW